jgi:hypothetical protein
MLKEISQDTDFSKVFVGKYLLIDELVKVFEKEKGKNNIISKNPFIDYITKLSNDLDNIEVEHGAFETLWVDSKGIVVGRNFDFTLKSKNGDTVITKVIYKNIENTDYKKAFIQVLCEAKGSTFKNLVVSYETQNKAQNTAASSKIIYGDDYGKDYMTIEMLSDKYIVSDKDSKTKYMFNFLNKVESGEYKIFINSSGNEKKSVQKNSIACDYNVQYDISSTKKYKGKFDLKIDSAIVDELALPDKNISPIIDQNIKSVMLNSIDEKSLNDLYLDIQVYYKAYQRKIAELFGLELAGKSRLN